MDRELKHPYEPPKDKLISDIHIPKDKLETRFTRSSGPGGYGIIDIHQINMIDSMSIKQAQKLKSGSM